MAIEISTQVIHASIATILRGIDSSAEIFDNPTQQGTPYPAWYIVHRTPVERQREIGNRYVLVYQIDIWYMLKQNITRLYDQYTAIAEQLQEAIEYLPIYGHDGVLLHTYDNSWGLEMNAMKYSITLRIRCARNTTPDVKMRVIDDLRVFLKGLGHFYKITFTNDLHPEFDVTLPPPQYMYYGGYATLPCVSAKRWDDDRNLWTPSAWSIGGFGNSVGPVTDDMTTSLLWESTPYLSIHELPLAGMEQSNIPSYGMAELRQWDGSDFSGDFIPYDVDYVYAATVYSDDGETYRSAVGVFEPVDIGGILGVKNVSDSIQEFRSIHLYSCLSETAIVIPVYDSSNVAYNAFKYTEEGVDNYYVLDGVQTEWTNDLASIGYSETPAQLLPTVSISEELGCDTVTISSGSSTGILKTWGSGSWTGSNMPWDGDKAYSSTIYSPGVGNRYNSYGVFEPVNVTGYVGAKNVSNASKAFRYIVVAVCSDSTATVVTVYDANNAAYNAFKYTLSGTDYYYVLDGTQTDWTDDLAGIGYSLTPNYLRGFMNASKTVDYLTYGSSNRLYDESGNLIISYDGKTYTLMGVYDARGNSVSYTNVGFYAYSHNLYFDWNTTTGAFVAYVEYTVE